MWKLEKYSWHMTMSVTFVNPKINIYYDVKILITKKLKLSCKLRLSAWSKTLIHFMYPSVSNSDLILVVILKKKNNGNVLFLIILSKFYCSKDRSNIRFFLNTVIHAKAVSCNKRSPFPCHVLENFKWI
jgi:hypothetical protein